jgi:hypothetical protein
MTALCARFPSLREVPGTNPFDAIALLHWLTSGAATSGSRWAALFVLQVWNNTTDWRKVARENGVKHAKGVPPRFDLFEAWPVWDDAHRAAAQTWLKEPIYP